MIINSLTDGALRLHGGRGGGRSGGSGAGGGGGAQTKRRAKGGVG